MTFFLAVKAIITPRFANHGSLPETNEESIIVPAFQGFHGVIKCWGVHLGCRLHLGGIQLSWADCVSIIPLFGGWLSMIALRQLLRVGRSGRGRWWVMSTCKGVILLLLQQCPQQVQRGGMRLILQMNHHGVVFR